MLLSSLRGICSFTEVFDTHHDCHVAVVPSINHHINSSRHVFGNTLRLLWFQMLLCMSVHLMQLINSCSIRCVDINRCLIDWSSCDNSATLVGVVAAVHQYALRQLIDRHISRYVNIMRCLIGVIQQLWLL